MKDVEQRLGALSDTKPRREPSANFTNRVMLGIELDAAAQRTFTARLKGFVMHKLTKPVGIAASFAVLALTAGTSFAAVQWLQPKATIDTSTGITTLANGNKRFWVDYASCQGQKMPEQHKSYYEIAATSKITPEQLTKSLEASCEADLLDKLFPETMSNAPKGQERAFKPGQEQHFMPYVTLKSVGANYLIVDTMLNGEKFTDVRLALDNTDRLYEKGEKIDLAKLHPGDPLTLITHTTALDTPYSTETLQSDKLSQLSENGFPRGTTIKGAIKRQYDIAAYNKMSGAMGTDWTRLVEDKKSPDGWRQLVPFDHKYPQQ